MRIKINFKGSNTAYENNNLKQVKGWFEDNAIGRHNDMHDKFSNYSLSPMMGGKRNGKYISYPDGGYVYFTTMDIELINMVSNNLFCNCKGSKVGDLEYKWFESVPDFHIHSDFDLVRTMSPVLMRMKDKSYMTVKDEKFIDELLSRSKRKLIKAGLNENKVNTLNMSMFHPENASTVNMQYNGIPNIGSKVMLVVTGDKHVRETLYSMGLGMSTGCGFGTVTVNE